MEKRTIDEVTAVVVAPPKYEIPQEVTDAIKKQCGKIIVVRGRQRAMQRNIGLRLAKTKYVLMVDTDEILSTNYVKMLLSVMRNDVAVSFGINVPHPSLPRLAKLEEYFKCVATFQTQMQGGRLYNRNIAVKTGGFKVVSGELSDFPSEFLQRIKENGGVLLFEPKAVIFHLKNYTARKLVEAGLTCTTTRYNPLPVLFARIFHAPFRVFQHDLKVFNVCLDRLIFLLPFYGPLRQLLFFCCALVRKIVYPRERLRESEGK